MNPFGVTDQGPDYEAIEQDEIYFKKDKQVHQGHWTTEPKDFGITLIASPGDVTRAFERVFWGKKPFAKYEWDRGTMRLYEINPGVGLLLPSNVDEDQMGDLVYSILSRFKTLILVSAQVSLEGLCELHTNQSKPLTQYPQTQMATGFTAAVLAGAEMHNHKANLFVLGEDVHFHEQFEVLVRFLSVHLKFDFDPQVFQTTGFKQIGKAQVLSSMFI